MSINYIFFAEISHTMYSNTYLSSALLAYSYGTSLYDLMLCDILNLDHLVALARFCFMRPFHVHLCRYLKGFMDNMQYAEELLREFLVFRGFTNTLQSFEKELSTDIGRNFQVDKILDLVFSVYLPNYQADKLIALLNFFKQRFSSSSETVFISTLSKLEVSILRYYIVNALQSARHEKVVEFFQANGSYLLQKREDWTPWFGRSVFFLP